MLTKLISLSPHVGSGQLSMTTAWCSVYHAITISIHYCTHEPVTRSRVASVILFSLFSVILCIKLAASYYVILYVCHSSVSFSLCGFYPNVTTLRSGLCCCNSVRLSSVVCNVGAPFSGGWSFRQYFFTAVYAGHPLTSVQNFTEIVLEEPLRRES